MEGSLHRLYKRAVTTELRNEDYTVYVEPADSPLAGLWWASYRPDVLGILSTTFLIKVTVAECETTPTRQRILTKASRLQQTLVLQPQLHERHAVRPLVNYPPHDLESNQLSGHTPVLGDLDRQSTRHRDPQNPPQDNAKTDDCHRPKTLSRRAVS
jgi:hypothetical protein